MSVSKIVVHTDIIMDYLLHDGKTESVLRLAMQKFFCYTTIFNAMELFSIARNEKERRAVEQSMSAMKILGVNAKSAKYYGKLIAEGMKLPRMNALIAGICLESKLPVLSGQPKEFSGVKQLRIVPSGVVKKGLSAAEILGQVFSSHR
jgi:predicted nucleic acid-binding protein